MNLDSLKAAFLQAGCVRLYAKTLSANDNSKNQIYLSGSVEALHMFRPFEIASTNSSRGPTFKGKIDFGWLMNSGLIAPAPKAQLILYSQYPEVRLSGFLAQCADAPSELMVKRLSGRVLFMGLTRQSEVVAYVASPRSTLAKEFAALKPTNFKGVLLEVALRTDLSPTTSRDIILNALRQIYSKGWIKSKQLDSSGKTRPCNAPQCGGYTLEAELGVSKNSRAEADYAGWEVKSYGVRNFDRPLSAGPVTLFTPEPTGGCYRDLGFKGFMQKYGYPDKRGKIDRINFGGTYFVGRTHPSTGLSLKLNGFDSLKGKIIDGSGSIDLVTTKGVVAASWSFSHVLEHWNRKHRLAAYVPSRKITTPVLSYAYGHTVHLAEHTDHELFLAGLANGSVYYDPGIKVEKVSTENPRSKKRSQFRIHVKNLRSLYKTMDAVDVRE